MRNTNVLNIPDYLDDKTFYELTQILQEENWCIIDAVNRFLDAHKEIVVSRAKIAAFLSWYRRKNKLSLKINSGKDEIITHQELIKMVKEKLVNEHYRVVQIGNGGCRIPDLIAVKDNKLYQIEVEKDNRNTAYLLGKIDTQYDDVMFYVGSVKRKIICKDEAESHELKEGERVDVYLKKRD